MGGIVKGVNTAKRHKGYYVNAPTFSLGMSGTRTRTCEVCGDQYADKMYHSSKTKALCKECREEVTKKKCARCGMEFRKRPEESFTAFKNRKYCGKTCARRARWCK